MTPATNGSSASPLDRLGLTLGDLEDLEGATGLDVLGLLEKADERLPVSLLIGLVWVTMRRERPGLTLADVRDGPGRHRPRGDRGERPKREPGHATSLRVALARAWGIAPGELRDATLEEITAMTAVLEREAWATRGR